MASAPIVEKVANPQGGMADPNKSSFTANDNVGKSSFEDNKPSDNSAGLVEQLANLELRDEYGRLNGKPIHQTKIPATQHDERKLFVGGLPTNGMFVDEDCFFWDASFVFCEACYEKADLLSAFSACTAVP